MNISGKEQDLEQVDDERPWKSGNRRTAIRSASGRWGTTPRLLAAPQDGVGIPNAARVGDLALLRQPVFPPQGWLASLLAQAMPFPLAGQVCPMLATDIAGFSSSYRDDETRMHMRQAHYEALGLALTRSGIPWEACHREDRGDGALVVIPPDIPAGPLIGPFPALLRAEIRRHNRVSREQAVMRLRVAVHVGPVLSDAYGVGSADLIHLFRMLDARPPRKALEETSAELALVISEYVHDKVVLHNPSLAGRAQYTLFKSSVKRVRIKGWLCLEDTAQ